MNMKNAASSHCLSNGRQLEMRMKGIVDRAINMNVMRDQLNCYGLSKCYRTVKEFNDH